MKEYNRATKKWEEKTTEIVNNLKKPDMCRGKKPHDFMLRVPDYSNLRRNDDLPLEVVEMYYRLKDEQYKLEYDSQIALETSGVYYRYPAKLRKETKHYKCAVCGKEESVYFTPSH